jgi:hypothetical protein
MARVAVLRCCTGAKIDWTQVLNKLLTWVELRGFEPLTPSMRTRCATGLRYSPKTGSQRSKHQHRLGRSAPGGTGRPGNARR